MKVITMQKGNRYWKVESVSLDEKTTVEFIWGAIGGKASKKMKVYTKGKNIGRSNETNHGEQAMLEIESAARKKADKGYKVTEAWVNYLYEEIKPSETIKPMLASEFNIKKIKDNSVYTQPKLDGVRCLARVEDGEVKLYSRGGKSLDLLPHINKSLESLKGYDSMCIDGEIYIHGFDFQELVSATKKINHLTPKLQYHVFDCIVPDKNTTFKDRFDALKNINFDDNIKLVETLEINKANLESVYKSYLFNGYEGLMVRASECLYRQDKRSTQLLKHKPVGDAEFKIVGHTHEVMANNKKGVIYKCLTSEGKVFSVRPTGNMKERSIAYENATDSIGKKYTVKFQGLTLDGIPRFPIGKGFRYSS